MTGWLLVGPLVLLGVEVGILTPLVEFKRGWMVQLAHPLLFSGAFFALTLFVLLTAEDVRRHARPYRLRARVTWLVINLIAYGLLFSASLLLHDRAGLLHKTEAGGGLSWLLAGGWLCLVVVVGVSAWLVFLPWQTMRAWLVGRWETAVGCALLGLTLIVLTPVIREAWHGVCRPAIAATAFLLRSAGHSGVIQGTIRGLGDPVIGARDCGVVLRVTPYCAELESLAAFLMMGITLMIARGRRVNRSRLACLLVVGLGLLYLLNAVRLFVLIEIAGLAGRGQLAVNLAHSRLGGLALMGVSVLILAGTRRWWMPAARAGDPAPSLVETGIAS